MVVCIICINDVRSNKYQIVELAAGTSNCEVAVIFLEHLCTLLTDVYMGVTRLITLGGGEEN